MNEELYMQRALQLAEKGKGSVSPNPLVGCVIVAENRIIGEGYHKKYGEAHAEVNALNSISEEDKNLLQEATVYVTLEPCSHFGKTPPCADALIKAHVKKVVIATLDPNPLVAQNDAGRGIQKLKDAGIEVFVGMCEQEAKYQNRRFMTAFIKKRPYIILKWAQTADGFIARKDGSSKWISNGVSRKLVHKWRSEEDGIVVGKNTVLQDNPKLNVREWTGKNPTRIILAGNGFDELNSSFSVFDDSQATLFYAYSDNDINDNSKKTTFVNKFLQTELIELNQINFWQELFKDLHSKNIHSVFIEGGSKILHSLIENEFYDEIRRFTAPNVFFNEGFEAPKISISPMKTEFIEDNKLEIFIK
ncbi:diaminohydroxyphosphoribosylaminopyrimidine deaminase [Bernardetia litoralis DSM 6794]|uniref:Riboflavin biosynthesis protein RibD n=1 Tax=Bernardetia litoralis (strain ATCC 23117 / DSM 6794 / NBRC 15988 / NCIMB 1366 / Fx l1 / Sio-4) TaxID=880071 RepID=I4AKH6_BERLS|nr:bifunctional diaminohydroxyphosphoribosylaminopyrimidine deaminase/5-amino-6-(5-phosphoribosylamino)uracil reductase RibD [Bernardetia litoralis]AFM04461.1 diaminohydroxyphosphoribosylaminopyrimidine deaminase [Bernardetia litoralis DSM 6794]